jgi:hypothetical protein
MIGSGSTFSMFVSRLLTIVDALMVMIIALIVVLFMWRLISAWILHGGDEKEVERGKQSFLVGIVVLVCVIGLWGLVLIVENTLFGG